MNSLQKTSVLLLLMALPFWLQAQSAAQQQSESQDSGAAPAATDDRATVPPVASISGSSLSFASELERSNYLRGGFGIGASFDDNALNTGSNTVSDVTYSFFPQIAFDFTTTRLRWMTSYAAGLTIDQRLSQRNQGTHNLGMDLQYRLSPHVTLGLHDHFLMTNGFFGAETTNQTTDGTLHQSNQSLITPIAKTTSNNAAAELSYQFSAGDMVGISGSFYNSHFSDVQGSTSLTDTTSEAAGAYYTHRLTPKNWIGVRYGFTHLGYNPGTDQSFTHSILYFHTIYLKPNMQLSFFGGPEFTQSDSHVVSTVVTLPLVLIVSVPVSNHITSGSAGATFSWQGQFTSARAEVIRRVSDGGGLTGSVITNSVSGGLRRQISRSMDFGIDAGYGNNSPLVTTSSAGSINSSYGAFSVNRKLGNSLGLTLGYSRNWQKQSAALGAASHNRAWATLSYSFSRPIGR